MKLLVIDLGDAPVQALVDLVRAVEFVVVQPAALPDDLAGYDGVIVVGASTAKQPGTELLGMLDLAKKPLLGIGAGFETATTLLGFDMASVYERGEGSRKLVPTEDGAKLFQGTDPLSISETERWLFDEAPRGIQILARSESGIEALRHKQKPVMALQQLPEDFAYNSDAKLVYSNLLTFFGKM